MSEQPPGQMSPPVFIIDDDRSSRSILETIVRQITREVHSFACPQEALEQVEGMQPELLMVDYMMKPLNGLQFIEKVRAIPGYGEVPIVVITLFEERDIMYQALEHGATAVLRKPLDHY